MSGLINMFNRQNFDFFVHYVGFGDLLVRSSVHYVISGKDFHAVMMHVTLVPFPVLLRCVGSEIGGPNVQN